MGVYRVLFKTKNDVFDRFNNLNISENSIAKFEFLYFYVKYL
jgi:hypothetical protein